MEKDFILELKDEADAGEKEAAYDYGMRLLKGEGVVQNLSLAFSYLLSAADKKNKKAFKELGRSRRSRNFYDWLKKLSTDGNGRAQYELAKYYDTVLQDPERAFPLYLAAANQNEVEAVLEVFMAYWYGKGIKENHLESYRYLDKFAVLCKKNHLNIVIMIMIRSESPASAREILDVIPPYSVSAEVNFQLAEGGYEQAENYYRAAKRGHAQAAYIVAQQIAHIPRWERCIPAFYVPYGGDIPGFYEWEYREQNDIRCNELNNCHSFFDKFFLHYKINLDHSYFERIEFGKYFFECFLDYMKIAADAGLPEAAYWFGTTLVRYNTYIVENPSPLLDTTYVYYKEPNKTYYSKDINIMYSKAFHYLKLAAEGGNVDAMFKIGQAYRDGLGVAQDSRKALIWFEKYVAEGGEYFVMAHIDMGKTYIQTMDNILPDRMRGIELIMTAADQNDAEAQYLMGNYYSQGIEGVIERDADKAHSYYMKAGSQTIESFDKNYGFIFFLTAETLIGLRWFSDPIGFERWERLREAIKLSKEKRIENFIYGEGTDVSYRKAYYYWLLDGGTKGPWWSFIVYNYGPNVLGRMAYEYLLTDWKTLCQVFDEPLKTIFSYFYEAARCGDEFSLAILGDAYNTYDIRDWYKHLANKRNAKGEVEYANLLVNEGASFLDSPCKDLYLDAANQGDPIGLYMAYKIYRDVDQERCISFLKAASDMDCCREADYEYACYLLENKEKNKDDMRIAFQLFEKACKEYISFGDLPDVIPDFKCKAYIKFADCLRCGIGTEKHADIAENWYRASMDMQRSRNLDGYVLCNLGILYYVGDEYLKRDAETAYSCFRNSADIGYEIAQYFLGIFYSGWLLTDTGEVVIQENKIYTKYDVSSDLESINREEIDLAESFSWFVNAAEKGVLPAIEILGDSFTTKDIRKWYEILAKSGYAPAQFQLAEILQSEKDLESKQMAIRLYTAAASKGHMESTRKLALYYRTVGDEKEKQFEEHLRQAANEKFLRGLYEYSLLIYDKNISESCKFLKEAADLGSINAALRLGWIYYDGNEVLTKNLREAYDYFITSDALFLENKVHYPHGVKLLVSRNKNYVSDSSLLVSSKDYLHEDRISFGAWLYSLAAKGEQEVWKDYDIYAVKTYLNFKESEEILNQLASVPEKNDSHINENIRFAFVNLCDYIYIHENLGIIFSHIKQYFSWLSEHDELGELSVSVHDSLIYYKVSEFLSKYRDCDANKYINKQGNRSFEIYHIPDLSKQNLNIKDDLDKDFWYDCALCFDLNGLYEDAILIYEYAALIGSRKAWYSLINMGQKESMYFVDMVDSYDSY